MTLQLDDYRLLGRSGLRVSPLCLGTMTFGLQAGWGSEDAEARAMVDRYVDLGGNFIDTANFYGGGGAERVLAQSIEGRREQLVIATKYSLIMRSGDPNACGNHRKNLVQSVEDSLRRLGTDYIDLMYLHVWDGLTPVDEILRAFDDLVRAGKLLYVGISDTPAWQIARMQAIAELRGWAPLIAVQIPYNLTQRTVEREYMGMAREMGLGVLPWSPLAGGVLSGKYSAADLETSGQGMDSRKAINLATGRLTPRALEIAGVVDAIAAETGRSSAQIALAWTLLNPSVTAPIIGARTLAQMQDNLAALDVELDDDQRGRLDTVSRIESCFPYDMLGPAAAARMFGGIKIARHGSAN
ncbi:aldo/keto reductase [uncultured Abyssibacter sp.]|uniref:aldo/keto reductase n=1 Tax=uncultured Abyssibacter sp. TaxID=2320202 RepID=UPI0032B1CBA1